MGLLERTASTVSAAIGRNHPVINRLRPSYEWLLDVANGWRGVAWTVNDEAIRIDPRVRRLVAQTTEPELWEYLRVHVHRGERVLDVGSFLGAYAVVIARWAGPEGRVLAFEPTPATLPFLRRHLRLNGVEDRVTVIEAAAGDKPGFAEIHEHSDPYRNAIGAHDPNGLPTGTSRVSITTIDEICRARQFVPTLLRMDIQGFEYAALRGARDTIAATRGRLRIVLEVHPQLWPHLGITEKKFDALLKELGVRALPLRRDGPRYEPDGHVELVAR